jgi:hypothetical protein
MYPDFEKRRLCGILTRRFFLKSREMEFFNSEGPGPWSGQSGKELVLAAPFLHPEMERQAMEVGRSGSGGFWDTEQRRGSKFRAQSSGYSWCKPTDSDWKSTFDCAAWPLLAAQKASNR